MLDLAKLDEAFRYEGGVSRRMFLAYSASISTLPMLGRLASAKTVKPELKSNPFTLGVASGDPSADGFVLWTRLAPEPLEPTGGMDPQNVEVAWEIASDDAMKHVVRKGTAVATPELAHSVHVEANGLAPDRWYWYRFRVGDVESLIGRTRTMPSADAAPTRMQFAFASCQNYEAGLYTAYKHMAEDELDLVLHLGDYIYEGAADTSKLRRHTGGVLKSLADYRIRHSLYKTDKDLQAMHARCPWMVTWDDHEVANDYANDAFYERVTVGLLKEQKQKNVDPANFLKQRAAAYQAYYEMMPLRAASLPRGPEMQLHRSQSFGKLANFCVLDGRQYRTLQPNGDMACDINDACFSPDGTMLGKQQYKWLTDTLSGSQAAWNVLAQQTIMAMIDIEPGEAHKYPMDNWNGYLHERGKLMSFLSERKIANAVVLTGDNHANWVNDLRMDDRRPETPVVATEFVGTSISSGGNVSKKQGREKDLLADNPGVRFFNNDRGYVRCTLTPKEWRTDFRIVDYVDKPGSPVSTLASYVVEAGQPGAKRV
jgi:alkaline phosphatase D